MSDTQPDQTEDGVGNEPVGPRGMYPGMHVIPFLPNTFSVNPVKVTSPNGEIDGIMFHAETPTGSTVLCLSLEDGAALGKMFLEAVAAALEAESGGLVVPPEKRLIVPGR